MTDAPKDGEAAGARAAEIVDLFARDKAGGQSFGLNRLLPLLVRNDKGGVMATLANMLLILAHDPPLAGMFGFNEFTSEHLLMRAPPPGEDGSASLPGPYPRPWQAADVAMVQAYLQRVWSSRVTRQSAEDAMLVEAEHRRFHPVRDWLGSLKFDGNGRLDAWLSTAFGCPDDEYHRSIGAKFLIAAVRRVRQPGCKFDHLPVLEGDQGIGKSRACRALFGDPWYSDAIPEELGSRDAALALLGVWGLEFAEIQHLIRNEVEVIKAFLSRSVDRYRPPYAKAFIERPRQGVLIGTTNADDYLRDVSGNRRIWPIRCTMADVEWIAANRTQLWAEAAAREAAGEAIWLDHEGSKEAAEVQADRMSEDVWTEEVLRHIALQSEVKISEVLTNGLQMSREKQGRREEMRVAAILAAAGWKRHIVKLFGKTTRVYRKGL